MFLVTVLQQKERSFHKLSIVQETQNCFNMLTFDILFKIPGSDSRDV